MKKIILLLTILVSVMSCTTESKPDYIVLRGKILNKDKDKDKVQLSSLCYGNRSNIPVNEDGTFIDTLHVDAENVMLFHGGRLLYMYLEAGDDINVSFDMEDFNNSIKFSGKGAAYNTYLLEKSALIKEGMAEYDNIYLLNESEYKIVSEKQEAKLLELLSNTKNLPQEYIKREERNIKYGYLKQLNDYESNHGHYTKNADYKVTSSFLNGLEDIDYNNFTDFVFSYSYSNLLYKHLDKEAKKIADSLGIEQDVAYMKALNTLENQKIKNIVSYKKAEFGITITADLEQYFSEYLKASTNEANNENVRKSYELQLKVASGNPSPKFTNYKNIDGSTTSLDDFKGKYVYIDVWATWCAPCKAEIPFLKEIEKKYHDKNIEFVSISVDQAKNTHKWEKMVKDMELEGVQIMADKDFESQFIQDYFIKAIPKFILLDPQGRIVTSNAPRPSEPSLVTMLETLEL
ncbi:TlpA family protein disulfide reductase [Pseudotamlana agarivorans]|uniref:TlpA family protein disulfide reductase n=1 Tax=Pseudotamlana agarivorans TaxID=481183 RepID=UPI00082EE7B1|nr:TlpA disulfide reductase family protein [Tamlana agarivorans]